MPISYIGSNSVLNSSSGSSTAVPMPSGLTTGNVTNSVIFVMLADIGNSPVPTAPTGWTLVGSYSPGTTLTTYLYRKAAASADVGATYTWTWSSGGRNLGVSMAYNDVDLTGSTNASQVWTHDVANAPIVAPSVSANTGDWLVTVGVGRENPGTATTKDWSCETTGDAQRVDIATAGLATDVKVSLGWFDSAGPLAAGSTARTLDVTPVQQASHVWSILLSVPAGESVGGNPWTHLGLPQR